MQKQWVKALICHAQMKLSDISLENSVLVAPGKAANAGGVATSALEMCQKFNEIFLEF